MNNRTNSIVEAICPRCGSPPDEPDRSRGALPGGQRDDRVCPVRSGRGAPGPAEAQETMDYDTTLTAAQRFLLAGPFFVLDLSDSLPPMLQVELLEALVDRPSFRAALTQARKALPPPPPPRCPHGYELETTIVCGPARRPQRRRCPTREPAHSIAARPRHSGRRQNSAPTPRSRRDGLSGARNGTVGHP